MFYLFIYFICPYLIHENIKDARGNRQREEGEEKSEEPGGGVHGCVKALGSEMDVQLGKLLLKKTNFNADLKQLHQNKEISAPWRTEMILQGSCGDVLLLGYLEQILKLVDAETQLSHAGLEQFPQTVLLHQTHKHTKGLLLWHLREEQRMCRCGKSQFRSCR